MIQCGFRLNSDEVSDEVCHQDYSLRIESKLFTHRILFSNFVKEVHLRML